MSWINAAVLLRSTKLKNQRVRYKPRPSIVPGLGHTWNLFNHAVSLIISLPLNIYELFVQKMFVLFQMRVIYINFIPKQWIYRTGEGG